ncbi:putative GCN1 [Toxoplasma gondii TgCatPRC2]|uniref:Putative GCN1 n=1 Tax=Toxoplasma gondii TgCatPRC2 TaxID=1130821 RepID=A0A151H371_TOXGO|nr:putative GCN1 [Toxoplasma gondii TgCatPRC2]
MSAGCGSEEAHNGAGPPADTPLAAEDSVSLSDALQSSSLAARGGSYLDELANSLDVVLSILQSRSAEGDSEVGLPVIRDASIINLLTSAVLMNVATTPDITKAASSQLQQVLSVVRTALVTEAHVAAGSPVTDSGNALPVLTSFCQAAQQVFKRVRTAPAAVAEASVARFLGVLCEVVHNLSEADAKVICEHPPCSAVFGNSLVLLSRTLAPAAKQASTVASGMKTETDILTVLERQLWQPVEGGLGVPLLRGSAVRLLERLCHLSPSIRELLLQHVTKGLSSPLSEGDFGPYISVYILGRYLRQILLSTGTFRCKGNKGGDSPGSHTALDDEKKKLLAAKKATALEMRNALLKVYIQAVVEARQPVGGVLCASFRPLLSLVQEGDWSLVLPPLKRGLKRSPNAALAAAVCLVSSSSVECSGCFIPLLDEGLLDILKSSSVAAAEMSRLQATLQLIGLLAQRCSDTAVLCQVIVKRLYEPLKKGSLTKAGERLAFLGALSECLLSSHLRRRFPAEEQEEWFSDFASEKSFFLLSLQNEVNEEVKASVCRVVGLLLAVSLSLVSDPSDAALKPFVSALAKLLALPGTGGSEKAGKSTQTSPRLASAALEALSIAAASQRSRVACLGILREAAVPTAAILPLATTKAGLRPECLQAWVLVSLLEELRTNEEGSGGVMGAGSEKEIACLVPKSAAQLVVEDDSFLNNFAAIERAQAAEELRSQLRFVTLLCARRPLVLSTVSYGFPRQDSGVCGLLGGVTSLSLGFLDLSDRSNFPFPPLSVCASGPEKAISSSPSTSVTGFHFGLVRLLMVAFQRRFHGQCPSKGASGSEEEAAGGSRVAPSSESSVFAASLSFFLSRFQEATRSVPELVDLLLLAFYFQLARFSAAPAAAAPASTGQATVSKAQGVQLRKRLAAHTASQGSAGGGGASGAQAAVLCAGTPPCPSALRATLGFLLTLRYPRASTRSSGASRSSKGGSSIAPSPQFNALLLLCLMHPLLQSGAQSPGHLIRAFFSRMQALCGVSECAGSNGDKKAGEGEIKKKPAALVAWDGLLALLPLAAQAPAAVEATGGFRAALFCLLQGIRGLLLAGKAVGEKKRRATSPGAQGAKAGKGTADAHSPNPFAAPALLRGLEPAAKTACSQLALLLGAAEMIAFSPQDVALYFARDDQLYREEGTYQAQEVEAKNVKKNKFQSALYGDLADELRQGSKPASGVPNSRAGAGHRKDPRGQRPGQGAGSNSGSANQTKTELEAEELALQQAQRRRMRASVDRTTYSLQCLGLLGESMPAAIEPLFSVHDESARKSAEAAVGLQEGDQEALGLPHAVTQLQVTFQDLLRSPLVSLEALKALRRIVGGGLVPQHIVLKRGALPDALCRVARNLPLEAADVELLATIHPEAVLSPAAAALILPVVSAILQNAQSSGLPASQQAMELLRQQLQLRAPLHAREVLACLSASLRAHPSLVSTAASALQDFCAYLLAGKDKKDKEGKEGKEENDGEHALLLTLLNVAVADEPAVRRAVVEALQAAPKEFLKKHLECIGYLLVLQQDFKEGEDDEESRRTHAKASKLLKTVWSPNEVVDQQRLKDVGVLLRTPYKGFQLLAAKAFASLVADLGGASQLDVVMSILPQLFSWYRLESYPEGAERAAARREARRLAQAKASEKDDIGFSLRGGAKAVIAYQKKDAEDPFFSASGAGRKGQRGATSPQASEEKSPAAVQSESSTAAPSPRAEVGEEEAQESLSMKLGVAQALQCVAEKHLLVWEEAVQEVLRFLLTTALTAREAVEDEGLQQALLAVGVATIQHCGTDNEDDGGRALRQDLFHVIERAAKKGATRPGEAAAGAKGEEKARNARTGDVQSVLNVACSVFFGAIAENLDGSDPTVKKIIKELVACIVDPRSTSPDVQRTVSRALSPLIRLCASGASPAAGEVSENQAFCLALLSQMLESALTGDDIVVRRGGARALGGIVKGLGILTLKTQHVMDTLKEALESKDGVRRQGALLCIEALSDALGRLFEPYTLNTLSLLLTSFSDTAFPVRLAAQQAARQIMAQLSGHGVKLVLPTLIEKLNDPQWRTKVGSIELLAAMTHCAPRQLASCLPQVVPLLSEVMSDTCFPKVRESARDALFAIAEVISNPEIKQLAPQVRSTARPTRQSEVEREKGRARREMGEKREIRESSCKEGRHRERRRGDYMGGNTGKSSTETKEPIQGGGNGTRWDWRRQRRS